MYVIGTWTLEIGLIFVKKRITNLSFGIWNYIPLIREPIKTKKYWIVFTGFTEPHLISTSDFKTHVIEADNSGILTQQDINFFVKIVDKNRNGTINIKEDMEFAFFHY